MHGRPKEEISDRTIGILNKIIVYIFDVKALEYQENMLCINNR